MRPTTRFPAAPRLLLLAATFLGGLCPAAEPAKISLRFDFGAGAAAPGFTQVLPTTLYTDAQGYGLEPGPAPTAGENGGEDPLQADFLTSAHPFYFSARVPEGNYRVTVTFGDTRADSVTTVKAELRRLMLERVSVPAGRFLTRSFIVNVRRPQFPGGAVSLKKPRETVNEAVAWDDRLTLEFNDSHPAVCGVQIESAEVPTVFLLGDSTVCDQSGEPYASWGQMLPRFFGPTVAVANHGESGETVRGATGAKRFEKVLSLMRPGDYLLIQFGHNDMKGTTADVYQGQLRAWLPQIRRKGGIPVLITPMNRHRFEGDKVVQTLKDFPDAVRALAQEEKTALIDLNAMSKTLYEALGPRESMRLFKHEGEDFAKFDATHHSPYGAYELAKCVLEGLKKNQLPLAKSITLDVPTFDPARPDPAARFQIPPSPGFTAERPLGD